MVLDFLFDGLFDGALVVGYGGAVWVAVLLGVTLVLAVIDGCFAVNNYIDSPSQYKADKEGKMALLQAIAELKAENKVLKDNIAEERKSIEAGNY